MALALLAPVPCCHLASAFDPIDGFSTLDTVAFGSDAIDLFFKNGKPSVLAGIPVLIYASMPDTDGRARMFKGPYVSIRGSYLKWQPADPRTGLHPTSSMRPISTDTDKPVFGFWEITDFRRTKKPYLLSALRFVGNGKPVNGSPRGPSLVEMPSGFLGD